MRTVKHIQAFTIDEILPLMAQQHHTFIVNDKLYPVKLTGSRLKLISNTQVCACCGLKGTYFCLDVNCGSPHINLYAYGDVLMTLDHIIPKSKGGTKHEKNIQLLCCNCNNIKGNHIISLEKLRKKVKRFNEFKAKAKYYRLKLIEKYKHLFIKYNICYKLQSDLSLFVENRGNHKIRKMIDENQNLNNFFKEADLLRNIK
jgi:5-methylcytosine-specific restriction endonuclease McrA